VSAFSPMNLNEWQRKGCVNGINYHVYKLCLLIFNIMWFIQKNAGVEVFTVMTLPHYYSVTTQKTTTVLKNTVYIHQLADNSPINPCIAQCFCDKLDHVCKDLFFFYLQPSIRPGGLL